KLIDYVWLPAVTAKTGKEVRRSFDAAGLACQNCHFSWSDLHENYGKTTETAHALGLESVVCQSLPSQTKTVDGWKWHADHLNELGRKTKRDDLLTGYHNHPTEFKEIDGVIPFDVLLHGTDPSLVKMQLDVGSVAVAGKDPVVYLTKYPDRYFSIHIKDVRDGKIGIAAGEGTLDWKKIFAAAKPLPLQNYVVETGARPDEVMEKLRQSVIYLRELES
ncbi:MAG TPA: sugar phosphate isomerase/epimerase, partial [Bryobacteraceae bacterium]|nr:sugar phosphate isomerase/epimerase [Bryobacteraceae bacterium]